MRKWNHLMKQLNLYETQQPLFLGESDSELKRCFTSPPPSKPTHLSSYDIDDELLLFLTDAILSSTVVDALIPNTEPYDPGPPKPPLTSSRSPLISTDSKLQIYAPTHNLTPSDDADYEVPPKFPDVISNIELSHTRGKTKYAHKVLDEITNTDIVAYTSIINAYAHSGDSSAYGAFKIASTMQQQEMLLNCITLAGNLWCCKRVV
ncbi:hypothetical protein RYX36_024787 [Vicia faba]